MPTSVFYLILYKNLAYMYVYLNLILEAANTFELISFEYQKIFE